MMPITRIPCEACGGNTLTKRNGFLECEFCGSRYMIDSNEMVTSKTLTDAKLISYYIKAAEYMRNKMFSEELSVLMEALAIDESDVRTLVKIGRCYRSLGYNNEALDAYKRALEIDPGMGTAYTNMGTIYILKKEWNEAAKQYEKGLPYIDKETADYWTAYANYAIVLAKLGNPSKAEEMIAEAETHGYQNGDKCRSMAGIEKKGCYIATAVYGSYDCPEVWTLRRFRDDYLLKRVWGRAFVRVYYAMSPTCVRWFEHTAWFSSACKGKLDILVKRLQRKGYSSTPYEDK